MKCDACGRETAGGVTLELKAANTHESIHGNRKTLTRRDVVPFTMTFCESCVAAARKKADFGKKLLSVIVLGLGAASIGLVLWSKQGNAAAYLTLAIIFGGFWAMTMLLIDRKKRELDRSFVGKVADRVRSLERNSWTNGRSWQQLF